VQASNHHWEFEKCTRIHVLSLPQCEKETSNNAERAIRKLAKIKA
jgi:hypothetical protein